MTGDTDLALQRDLMREIGRDLAVQAIERAGHPRIVVVEDEPTILEVLRDALTLGNYSVISLNHADTPAIAASLRPDVFLIDLMLPDINGIELAQRLRRTYFPRTPMIAMSASRDWLANAAASGVFQETLLKPFELRTLLDYVERYATMPLGRAETATETVGSPIDQTADASSRLGAETISDLLQLVEAQQVEIAQLRRDVNHLHDELRRMHGQLAALHGARVVPTRRAHR